MAEAESKRRFSWKQLACLAVTAGALVLIFARIDRPEFARALLHMKLGWWLSALASYGCAFLFAAYRWHLALRMVGCSVHPGATLRLAYIGHFFFIVFFGGVAGDVAKSALYSRWYKHDFPKVFAASPLDRLMGLAGLMVFGIAALFLSAQRGSPPFQRLDLNWPSPLIVAGATVGLAVLAMFLVWEPRGEGSVARMVRALRGGATRLLRTPHIALKGFVCGFFLQVALSAALAFSLQAVSDHPLPWTKMFWVFPVILTLSALPVTVAGLGVREGAAIFFLGLYGLSPSDAVAASLLSLAGSLLWAGVGGTLLWRESARRSRQPARAPAARLSVIIPTLNEAKVLPETIRCVQQVPAVCEIIVVDGGSEDRTVELAREMGCRVVESPPGRGGQMRRGAAVAQGDVLWFLHADTWVPAEAGRAALESLRDDLVVGGGFWKVFRSCPPVMRGSRWRCAVRLFLGGRIVGDQSLYVRRQVLESVGGFPDQPLMEEFELCRRLRRVGRLALADATLVTSARRFLRDGVFRTYYRMWWVTLLYHLGRSPTELRQIYERE